MKNKLVKAVIVLLISVLPIYNFININSAGFCLTEDGSSDIADYSELTTVSLSETEKRINGLYKTREVEREAQRLEEERKKRFELMKLQLQQGELTYRKVFSDTLIVGDSLMQGLNTYKILDSANMISMVSASLYHLEGNIGTIISNNPRTLILHYGINMLGNTSSQLDWFIETYEDILSQLKPRLPDTKIFVSSIFNVSLDASASYPNVREYNAALSQMCSRQEVIFLDNDTCLTGTESYYGSDGIHVSKAFYNDVWLPHIFSTLYEYGVI